MDLNSLRAPPVLNEIEPGESKTEPRTLELSNRRCQTRNRTPNLVRRERINNYRRFLSCSTDCQSCIGGKAKKERKYISLIVVNLCTLQPPNHHQNANRVLLPRFECYAGAALRMNNLKSLKDLDDYIKSPWI